MENVDKQTIMALYVSMVIDEINNLDEDDFGNPEDVMKMAMSIVGEKKDFFDNQKLNYEKGK